MKRFSGIASTIEFALIAVLAILFWFWLVGLPGREAHTDVLWYMNMGMNNVADPHWVTRYSHVYLQKIFLALADHPFDGLKAYWAFIMAVTAGLIYFSARKLTKGSTPLMGIAAVAIFFSFGIHSQYAGVALADMTSMAMVVLTVFIFIQAAQHRYARPWVILLGFVLFLAFEAKETTWFVFALVFGLGATGEKIFDRKTFGSNLANLAVGFLIGLGVFMVLNGIFLKDALFFFRASTLKTYFSFWLVDSSYYSGGGDWYSSSILADFPIPFLLYLLSGKTVLRKDSTIDLKLVWALPLFLVGFLSFGMLKNTYEIYDRFLFPVIALVSMLAPQFMQFEPLKSRSERIKFTGIVILAVLFFFLFRRGTAVFTNYTRMDYKIFMRSIVTPLVFTFLLLVILWIDRFSLYTVLIPALCLSVLLQAPITENINSLHWVPTGGVIQRRFYPLDRYAGKIGFDETSRVFVSVDLPSRTGFLSGNIDTVYTLFNLYFKTNAGRGNFILEPVSENLNSKIREEEIDYAFLSRQDWDSLGANPSLMVSLGELCRVYGDESDLFVLLECR